MELSNKIILTIAYSIISLLSILYIYKNIKKNKTFGAIDFFNSYYVLVYFLVPIFFMFNNYEKFHTKYSAFLEYDFRYHLVCMVTALMFFILTNIAYKKIKIKKREKREINTCSKTFILLNIVFSIIGILSYYMWSKAYGFPFGILKYADALRDNIIILDNPFTFFQPLSNFVIFAAYNWLVIFKECKKSHTKILSLLLFIITFFFSILATFATDSRSSIIILFLIPVIFLISNKKNKYILIGAIALIAIFLLGKIDNFTSSTLRGETYKKSEFNNVLDLLSYEFGFTYSNRINQLYNMEQLEEMRITEIDDIQNILISWIPKSMKPKELQTLSAYNTALYDNPSGAIPTDIVTASVYKGRILGLILLPLFMAFVLKFFDMRYMRSRDNYSKMLFYYFCIAITLRFVAYYDLSSILFERFAFIVYYLTTMTICRNKTNDKAIAGSTK